MMQDGKIIHEDIVGDIYTEDLKVLARSDFGQAMPSMTCCARCWSALPTKTRSATRQDK
jgi:hypothetical protein